MVSQSKLVFRPGFRQAHRACAAVSTAIAPFRLASIPRNVPDVARPPGWRGNGANRSEEHTSELQSHSDLVCRLLLEKKKIVRSTLIIRPDYHKYSQFSNMH